MAEQVVKEQDILDLYDLMLEQIRDLYDGEQQQLAYLAEAEKQADSFDLKEIVRMHRRETKKHLSRLENIFKILREEPAGEECDGIKGLIKEAMKLADRCKNSEVCDAGLITSIQHINHYEMAGYGTAIAYSKVLERHDIGELLLKTLREEKEADMELSDLAEDQVNVNAKWTAIVEKSAT